MSSPVTPSQRSTESAPRGDDRSRAGKPGRIGVLLVNLGTPDAPTPAGVRRFLREMLSDPRLVALPRVVWLPILHGVVLPLRPRRSAEAYRRIWTPEGSPQLAIGRRLTERLGARLTPRVDCTVAMAMTYGSPSVREALDRLRAEGAGRLVVLPLYPQYAGVTIGAAYDRIDRELARSGVTTEQCRIEGYHEDAGYIDALRTSVEQHWDRSGRGDHVLMSFHGVPKRLVERGDPYRSHVESTATRLASALRLGDGEWSVSFQSRFGYQEWLQPYTDESVGELAARGVRRLTVICPGFAVDCLESLEEIAMAARRRFLAAGGAQLDYVPALNDRPEHVDCLARIVLARCAGWI